MTRVSLVFLGFFFIFHAFVLVFAGAGGAGFVDVARALVADLAWSLLLGQLTTLLFQHRARLASALYLAVGSVLALFLVVAFGFAKLYQRPFALGFVRTDTASIWKENVVSGLYELALPHLFLAVAAAACLLIAARLARTAPKQPLRQVVFRLAAALLVIVLTAYWWGSPSLMANPLTAAFGARHHEALRSDMALGEDDLVPALDSPEGGTFLPAVAAPGRERRNVILYFLESTPASVIGRRVQGKEVTPNLNRLAANSLYFARHYANFPLSINAFYNAFCSAYALPDGAWISLALPDFAVPCLSQILGSEGYRSIALHAGYLGYAKQKRFMQKRNFDEMHDAETLKKPPYEEGMGPWGAADERAMIRPLLAFAKAKPDAPFLAVMFAFAPHHPYNAPDGVTPLISADATLKKSQVRYFNSLNFADTAFGEILTALSEQGILQNSILVVVGDHGEAFYEHAGNYNHPFFLYEENIHVPLMISVDGASPQIIERVTSHVDILPTVLDLLNLKHRSSAMHNGKSMLRAGPQSVAHLQAYWQDEFSGIVSERHKFIRKGSGSEELFDLHEDISESRNIAAEKTAVAGLYRDLTAKAFAQKKAYYKKYGNYELTRFNPASQDK
jgi:arylsulfatase A-like enzyme